MTVGMYNFLRFYAKYGTQFIVVSTVHIFLYYLHIVVTVCTARRCVFFSYLYHTILFYLYTFLRYKHIKPHTLKEIVTCPKNKLYFIFKTCCRNTFSVEKTKNNVS